ncbi:uncharacterized protein KY384_000599 [Bacidia gigantensis]|uniref:uncharacterized protein n=1 Tax=Bacidia gigantensis TaxID=2732470 RepID=UPI001D04D79D|nr:uncharacterized protein KY384_000599 [Bacidia gigantensis]KAG8525839.1 hypothetical protein KY384_000599 [Bacidia gigantensis]
MRLALRLGLAVCSGLLIALVLLNRPITNFWDQYGVASYIKTRLKTSLKDGTLDYLPALPGATGDKIIVMAKLEKDDINFISSDLSDWQSAIYTVNPTQEDPFILTTPVNKGREAMAYLTYIIDNYSTLPSIIAFLHPHRDGFFSAWHTDTPLHSNVDAMHMLNLSYVKQQGYVNLRCKQSPGCLEKDTHNAHVTPAIYKEVFSGTSTAIDHVSQAPTLVGAACCAQFAVSNDQARKRPLSDYESLRAWVTGTSLSDAKSGRVMEFLWHVVFGMSAV